MEIGCPFLGDNMDACGARRGERLSVAGGAAIRLRYPAAASPVKAGLRLADRGHYAALYRHRAVADRAGNTEPCTVDMRKAL